MALQSVTPRPYVVTDRLRLQRVFARMKQSCYDSRHASYTAYGKRGIYICAEWLDAESSEPFVQWALANGYKHGLHINRIDNNGPYSPANCNFVTQLENNRNQQHALRMVYEGVEQPIRVVLAKLLPHKTSKQLDVYVRRVSQGYSVEQAIAEPAGADIQSVIYEKAFVYNGKLARMAQHLLDAGFSTDLRTVKTCWARMMAGWPLTRVFTEPIARRVMA